MTQKNKTAKKTLSLEQIPFKTRFPYHKLSKLDIREINGFRFSRPNDEMELIECIIRGRNLIFLGDWIPAIYKFGLDLTKSENLAQLWGIHNEYMKSKCETGTHHVLFHKALQEFLKEIEKMAKMEGPK